MKTETQIHMSPKSCKPIHIVHTLDETPRSSSRYPVLLCNDCVVKCICVTLDISITSPHYVRNFHIWIWQRDRIDKRPHMAHVGRSYFNLIAISRPLGVNIIMWLQNIGYANIVAADHVVCYGVIDIIVIQFSIMQSVYTKLWLWYILYAIYLQMHTSIVFTYWLQFRTYCSFN
jgi:hypothetical protein